MSSSNDPLGSAGAQVEARLARWRDPATLAGVITVTLPLLAIVAGWFLLQQLTPILRPLLVAVFLAYVLMPYHSKLRKRIGAPASIGMIATATALALLSLAFVIYASVLGLSEDLPMLQNRAHEMTKQIEDVIDYGAPWASIPGNDSTAEKSRLTMHLTQLAGSMLNLAANVVLEACVIALYLLFLLLEGSRFPDRVRRAYHHDRAEEILDIAGKVSSAIVSFLHAKIRSSLVLAVPVGFVLWALGVKFAFLWAILTFLCNFIPYVGSVIAYSLPVGFAFLLYGIRWEPIAAAVLLLGCHIGSASIIEPMIIGKAVGLSPLVILASLAFWGLLWGIPGMFLAVPLTVVAMIVMDNFEATRAVARLGRGE